jgi:hypothetical protein
MALEGSSWVLQGADDDEPMWFVIIGVCRPGCYLTLYQPSGHMLTFQIVSVSRPDQAAS